MSRRRAEALALRWKTRYPANCVLGSSHRGALRCAGIGLALVLGCHAKEAGPHASAAAGSSALGQGGRTARLEEKAPPSGGSTASPGLAGDGGASASASAPVSPPPATTTQPTRPPVHSKRPSEPLNVIVLSVASLRADMPWLGYPRPIAPRLTQLAAESAVWENEHALSSHTPQSLAGILSGLYPCSLYRDGSVVTRYSPQNAFFPALLRKRGVRTIGVQADRYFSAGRGFEQGFDVWDTPPGNDASAEGDAAVTSPKLVGRLMDLLGRPENTAHPFFAWSHFPDPRAQYVVHPEAPDFGSSDRDRYDAEVFFTDLWLGKFLDFARAQPWWARTAVIVTADHGEAFGEHGLQQHGADLWEVLLRVPLLIHAPGAAPVRIRAARSAIDLAPTIVDLLGLPIPESFRGHSLSRELYGATPEARSALLFSLCEDSQNPGFRGLITGDDKLIVPEAEGAALRLFNLKQDPTELQDLSERKVGKLLELSVREEREFDSVPIVEPYGGMTLRSGHLAQGSDGPVSAKSPIAPSAASERPAR